VTSVSERPRARLARLTLLACCLFSARAFAQTNDNDVRNQARVIAAEGSEAFEQHDFQRALALFQRASTIVQAPTITLMQARTLVELGRLMEALDMYAATQRMVAIDPTNDAYRQAADAAQLELDPLLKRIPTVRVHVLGPAPGEQVDIFIDGKQVSPQIAAVERLIDPGHHRIEARASQGRTGSTEIDLPERARADAEVKLTPLPAPAPVVTAPPPAPPPPPAESSHWQNTLGWSLGIGGAAFTVVGVVTGAMALSDKSTLDDACKPGCPPNQADTIDQFRTERTLSYISFAVGAAGLIGGSVLILTSPKSGVAVSMGPNRLAFLGTFQ
jgi:hypothetical protein